MMAGNGCDAPGARGDKPPGTDPSSLRTGFTTGACAAACARAAVRALMRGVPVAEVSVHLPAGVFSFAITRCELATDRALCGTMKDGGDDPDATHGAEIQAVATWTKTPGIEIQGGPGVGRVTMPGLPVAIGEAAINPGPRRMILQAVATELDQKPMQDQRGVRIVIQVPEGERIAQLTMNPRLGILGGISILGTDGIVRPYSAPAYRAAVYAELNVARQTGVRQVVLSTGKRSEAYIMTVLSLRDGPGLIEVGDFIDYALKQAVRMKFDRVVIAGMIGKISKLAQGRMNTHINEGGVDFEFLAGHIQSLTADSDMRSLLEDIRRARTAHHVQDLLRLAGVFALEERLAQQAAEEVYRFVQGALPVSVYLFSLEGDLLGRGSVEETQ